MSALRSLATLFFAATERECIPFAAFGYSSILSAYKGRRASSQDRPPARRTRSSMAPHSRVTTITPGWPGQPYWLACPPLTTQKECDVLGGGAAGFAAQCSEPEADTQEVLSSLLLGCASSNSCLYVDVGCNMGYFAAQAAALGAAVDCFEPTPFFVEAARATWTRNGFSRASNITRAAVVAPSAFQQARREAIGSSPQPTIHLRSAYLPCSVGERDKKALERAGRWNEKARHRAGMRRSWGYGRF